MMVSQTWESNDDDAGNGDGDDDQDDHFYTGLVSTQIKGCEHRRAPQ